MARQGHDDKVSVRWDAKESGFPLEISESFDRPPESRVDRVVQRAVVREKRVGTSFDRESTYRLDEPPDERQRASPAARGIERYPLP